MIIRIIDHFCQTPSKGNLRKIDYNAGYNTKLCGIYGSLGMTSIYGGALFLSTYGISTLGYTSKKPMSSNFWAILFQVVMLIH